MPRRRRDLNSYGRYANRQLARLDAAERCPLCKRAIVVAVFSVPGDGKHYCSAECLEIARERAEHEEVAK
jgi:hypothetical protein